MAFSSVAARVSSGPHVKNAMLQSRQMIPNPLTTDPQTLTATGPAAPTTGLDISGLTGDYTLEITVMALSSVSGTPQARVVLEDTVNAFTNAIPVAELNLQGPVTMPVTQLITSDEAPSLRIGTTSARLRLNVQMLNGTTPSITVRGAIWQ
jgi:hypothetical protein